MRAPRPGFIPARAGNTRCAAGRRMSRSVHPRACGEHRIGSTSTWVMPGSSPRVRGTRDERCGDEAGRRFIPARAGNTHRLRQAIPATPVHPRACGEHATPAPRYETCTRFIPARAGNTWSTWTPRTRRPVHPRACGEHEMNGVGMKQADGSSPRVRGTLASRRRRRTRRRFIPARAGNTRSCRRTLRLLPVHPRACGEHFRRFGSAKGLTGSSPRVRGTRAFRRAGVRLGGFIPARAGNTQDCGLHLTLPSVHPRACGEHVAISAGKTRRHGSSPRVRGTPAQLGIGWG